MFNKAIDIARKIPLFLWLLPLYFIHLGYNELFGFLPINLVVRDFLIVAAVTLFVLFCSRIYLQDYRKAFIYTFIFILFNLFFGFFHDSIKALINIDFLTRYSIIVPLFFMCFIGFIIRLKKSDSLFYQTYSYFNALMIILLVFETGVSIKNYNKIINTNNLIDNRFTVYKSFEKKGAGEVSIKPDIFFIVFDEMPSSSGLKKYFGVENKTLEDSLIKKGFFIVNNSKSNYTKTIFSMASILNMDYLPGAEKLYENPATIFACVNSISNNSLFSVLKFTKYKLRAFQPFSFTDTEMSPTPFFKDLRNGHYLNKTLAGRLYRDVLWNIYNIDFSYIKKKYYSKELLSRNKRNKTILSTTELIKKLCSKNNSSDFFYGHYILPHSPYIFDKSGKLLDIDMGNSFRKSQNKSKLFLDQVSYANSIINDIVNHIQQYNDPNTIIIIMGDHGYRGELSITDNTAPYDNFSAIYFPDKNYTSLHDSLSAVNTFRVVLNKYFNTQLPLLKNKSFVIAAEDDFDSEKTKRPVNSPTNPTH